MDPQMLQQILRMLQHQQNDPTALGGELGQLPHEGGGYSTELSVGAEHPDLNGGQPTNFPLLVQGQTGVPDLLSGVKPTQDQIGIAARRAAARVTGGQTLPSYNNWEDADQAAYLRHAHEAAGIDVMNAPMPIQGAPQYRSQNPFRALLYPGQGQQ